MHNTPPPRPIRERDTPTLFEDLCVALREVGVWDGYLPQGQRAVKAIEDVRAIDGELRQRSFDTAPRIRELSAQTHWRMDELLDECRKYPQVIPFVREEDGIRRRLRCTLCQKAERPLHAKRFWMCADCLLRVIQSIQRREPIEHIILFRTYNVAARCEHADSETVLATEPSSDTFFGNCERCFEEELHERHPAQLE